MRSPRTPNYYGDGIAFPGTEEGSAEGVAGMMHRSKWPAWVAGLGDGQLLNSLNGDFFARKN